MVLVLVGATIVGSMATVWHGVVNPPRTGRISRHDYPGGQVQLAQGEEMGRFLLGSTVVLLLPEAAPGWNPGWQPGGPVCMGQMLAGAS
jgi:phosphatidylserine decarboxylase